MTTTVMLFDPTAPRYQPERDGTKTQPILSDLSGAVVGFIDNAKPNFRHLVDDLTDLLRRKYGISHVIKHRKSSASVPANPEVVEKLSRECDVVITGSGD